MQANVISDADDVDTGVAESPADDEPNIQWGDHDTYFIVQTIARGRFSEVFEGTDRRTDRRVALKAFKPSHRHKLVREVRALKHLTGGPNIIEFIDAVRDPVSGDCALVVELIDYVDFRLLFPRLTDFDIRYYMFELFTTLRWIHDRGWIHRDVKPHNLMIDHSQRMEAAFD